MKNNFWVFLGMVLSTSLLAQPVSNAPSPGPIETPAPAPAVTNTAPPALPSVTPPEAGQTNAPAAKPAKKKGKKKSGKGAQKKAAEKSAAAKKKAAGAELKTVPLVPGPAVVDANNVNVRGQPTLKSEVVTRLSKGASVTVLEEIVNNNSAPDEPSAWARIALPADVHVWVNTGFIDPADKTVKATRLNLRSGPGENYSVLGRLEKGEPVKELSTKSDWMEIEAPTNAHAFIAAQYLKQETPAAIASTTPEPAPSSEKVMEAPTVATAPTETPTTTTPVTPAPAETPAVTNAPAPTTLAETPPAPVIEEPPPKRVVQREGIVRGTFSIQAPTKFELVSPETRQTIDYLYTTSTNLDLRRYKGLRIIVTGEEGLEERWGNTPLLTIQKIHLAD